MLNFIIWLVYFGGIYTSWGRTKQFWSSIAWPISLGFWLADLIPIKYLKDD